jgi:hypothetical protein
MGWGFSPWAGPLAGWPMQLNNINPTTSSGPALVMLDACPVQIETKEKKNPLSGI